MATHPSILAQRIPMDRGTWWAMVHGVEKSRTRSPRTEEPGGLQSMGSHRVGHDPHGQRNLVGYSTWGHTELDTTERLSTHMYIPRFIHPFIR